MILDTDKIEDIFNEVYLQCSYCKSTECGDCFNKRLLDAFGTEVPEHPCPDPF